MQNEETTTPAPEVTEPETTVQTEQVAEDKKEPTVAETFGSKDEKKVADSVPIARLNKEIQRKKELEKEVIELRQKLESGDITQSDVTSDLKALAEEHNVDADFLDKLVKTIKAQSTSDFDEKLRPLTERDAADKREKAFTQHFTKALNAMPEFQGIVNPDVIKQMAFNPANADKTFSQLIEEAYGNSLQGKRTIETATPRGGPKTDKVDIDRARKDTEYFKEVMADPTLKKQYNESLEKRIQF